MRSDRMMLLEFACDVNECGFRLYFGKKTSTFNFILECSEFEPHNHELLIDKAAGKQALEKLDFAPLDNKFHLPLSWEAFSKPSPAAAGSLENPEQFSDKLGLGQAADEEVFHLDEKVRPKVHPLLNHTTQFSNKILPVNNLPRLQKPLSGHPMPQ